MDPPVEIHSKTSFVLKNPCLNLMLQQLYEQRHETGDIKFVFGREEIKAHRAVLSALSPKYKAQFYGGMVETNVIHVHDATAAAFQEYLRFFYMDQVTLTIDNIEDVLSLAKQSLVDDLANGCIYFLKNIVFDVEKLIWCYRLAQEFATKALKELCENQIKANIKGILETADFLSCKRSILWQILALQPVNCSETDIFDGCISWARKKCEHEGLDGANTLNLRAVLGDAIYRIRFCSMTSEEFALICNKYSGILTLEESIDVLNTIALKSKGATSTVFDADNSRSRKMVQPLSSECLLRKGSPILFDKLSDTLRFLCDKAIFLNGLIIHNRIVDDIEVNFTIDKDVMETIAHRKTIFKIETQIIFVNPVRLQAGEWCEISIRFKSTDHVKFNTNVYGFNIKTFIRQNGLIFSIPITYGGATNLITKFLYNVIE